MKGYISFVLVFISSIILLNALAVLGAARSTDLSGAVEAERPSGLAMNVRECVFESVRQGAAVGFASYDRSHDVRLCRHCPDNSCTPPSPINPIPPNICDATLCSQCFRSSEARLASESGALAGLMNLEPGGFDDEYAVRIGGAGLEARLEADALSKNGLGLFGIAFRDDLQFVIESEKRGFRGVSEIGKGMVVPIGPNDD